MRSPNSHSFVSRPVHASDDPVSEALARPVENPYRNVAQGVGGVAIVTLFYGGAGPGSVEVQLAVLAAGLGFALAAAHFFARASEFDARR